LKNRQTFFNNSQKVESRCLQTIASNEEFDCVTTNEATRLSNDEVLKVIPIMGLSERNSHYGITRKVQDLAKSLNCSLDFFLLGKTTWKKSKL